jgi:hypothetical protein
MTKEAQAAYDEALKRIEECHRKQDTSLDLTSLNLPALPPEIGQLTTLTQLDLARELVPKFVIGSLSETLSNESLALLAFRQRLCDTAYGTDSFNLLIRSQYLA